MAFLGHHKNVITFIVPNFLRKIYKEKVFSRYNFVWVVDDLFLLVFFIFVIVFTILDRIPLTPNSVTIIYIYYLILTCVGSLVKK